MTIIKGYKISRISCRNTLLALLPVLPVAIRYLGYPARNTLLALLPVLPEAIRYLGYPARKTLAAMVVKKHSHKCTIYIFSNLNKITIYSVFLC